MLKLVFGKTTIRRLLGTGERNKEEGIVVAIKLLLQSLHLLLQNHQLHIMATKEVMFSMAQGVKIITVKTAQ